MLFNESAKVYSVVRSADMYLRVQMSLSEKSFRLTSTLTI
jgi:hypothetical protein